MPSTKKCLKCDGDQVYTQTIAAPDFNNPDLWAGVIPPWISKTEFDMLVCDNCGYSELFLPAGIQSVITELQQSQSQMEIARLELHRAQHELANLRRMHADLQARHQALTDEVLDSSKVGIFILDADFKIVWVNRAIEHYFGLNQAEIIGQDKRRLIHQKIKKIVNNPEFFVERVLATYDHNTYIETFECQVFPGCACGDHWLEHWSQPIESGPFSGGRIEHYYDITKRKGTEALLRQVQEELEIRVEERTHELSLANKKLAQEAIERRRVHDALQLTQYSIDNSPVGIGWIGPDGRLVYVNEGAGRMLGYSRDELLAMTVHDIDPKFSAADWPARWQEMKERHAMIYESELQTKSGQIIPIEARINYLEFSGQEYLFVFVHNISRRKQAQELLQQSEERYRSLFEDSPISLWEEDFSAVKSYVDQLREAGVTDFRAYFESHPESVNACAAQVKVLDVNHAAVKIYQAQNKEDLIGRLGRFFASGAHAGFREELIALAEGKTTFEGERHLLKSRTLKGDKRYATLRWSVAPGCEETWAKVLVSILDITEFIHGHFL